MVKYIFTCIIGILIAASIYFFDIKGYTSYTNGYLYNREHNTKISKTKLFADDFADDYQKKHNCTDEERIAWKKHFLDSLDAEYDKGLYLPFLKILE